MPKLVKPGVNGYLVASVQDAVEAVGHVRRLDRRMVRGSIEGRFDAARMVDDYLRLYRRILENE